MDQQKKPRRSGGRRRAQAAQAAPVRTPNYRQLRHPFTPQTIFSADEVAAIHDTALRVLEELGMKILLSEAREIFSKAGARVQDDMVFVGRDIVAAALETAPSSIPISAINPAKSQIYEDGALIFMAVPTRPTTDAAGDRVTLRPFLKRSNWFSVSTWFICSALQQNRKTFRFTCATTR